MILHGDCLTVLPTLGAGVAQTCVTSPPYWGLRDYGVPPTDWPAMAYVPLAGLEPVQIPAQSCALGLEEDPHAFVAHTVAVFREVWRVLADDGTAWINFGDTYCDNAGKQVAGLPPKNLMGLPWRVALALQADGWILRRDVIWHKKAPMPETVYDRPTTAHEYLYLFAKQRRYYYDAEAIAEPCSPDTHARYARPTGPKGRGGMYAEHPEILPPARKGLDPGTKAAQNAGKVANRKSSKKPSGWDDGPGGHRDLTGRYSGTGVGCGYADGADAKPRHKNNPDFDAAMLGEKRDSRNKRSVWTLGPEPYRGAHFATYPPSLVRPCILAGSRPGDTVLDPFLGSGTTGLVATELGREFIGVELSPSNVAMATERTTTTRGLALA